MYVTIPVLQTVQWRKAVFFFIYTFIYGCLLSCRALPVTLGFYSLVFFFFIPLR